MHPFRSARPLITPILLALCTAAAQAEIEEELGCPEIANDLILTDSPFLTERGEVELTFGFEFFTSDEERETELEVEVEFGVTDWWSFEVGLPYVLIDGKDGEDDESGIGDVELGSLFKLVETDDLLLSAALGVTLTTGDEDRGLGAEDPVWSPQLLAAINVGPGQVYLGLGGELTEGDDKLTWHAAYAHPLGPGAGVLELSCETGGGEVETYLSPGYAWCIEDALIVTAGVAFGLSDDASDLGVVLRCTMEF